MQEPGILYVVATPIGNLEDVTLRALRVLQEVDGILCEDTRVTKRLLERYKIVKPLKSYHAHSKLSQTQRVLSLLEQGKNLALVSDAGTPGISDPGNELIGKLLLGESIPKVQLSEEFLKLNFRKDIQTVPIPGASTITAIASVAGINMSRFTFLGFPPHKKGRETFFREVVESKYPVIYFESPHRFLKNLELLEKFKPDAKLIVGRELTKMFEEIVRGKIGEIKEYWGKREDKENRGEFTIICH